jgi:hypothetical protein
MLCSWDKYMPNSGIGQPVFFDQMADSKMMELPGKTL